MYSASARMEWRRTCIPKMLTTQPSGAAVDKLNMTSYLAIVEYCFYLKRAILKELRQMLGFLYDTL